MKRQTKIKRAHQIRRARDELGKRSERARGYITLPTTRVVLSGNLDLIDNPVETRLQLRQLDAIRPQAAAAQRVHVNMRDITHLDPCALLHLAALTDLLGQRGFRVA